MTKKIIFLILLFTYGTPAFSEPDHYNNILVGDRAATMGGAYVGLSNDLSGTYYNPAGLAFADGAGISASANVYHEQHTIYKNAIRNNDWDRNGSQLLPNFFGLMKSWGEHTLAFSIVVPDSFIQHQDQIYTDLAATSTQPAIDRYAFNLHSEDTSYLIGPSYAYKVSDKFSLGATLSYFYRKSRMQDIQTIWLSGGQTEASTVITDWGEKGLNPKVGIRWIPFKPLSLGLTVSHTFIVSSNFTSQLTNKTRDQAVPSFDQMTTSTKRNTGTQISLGIAYQFTEKWLLSYGMDFFTRIDADSFYPFGYQGVVNLSLGTEYIINKKNVVRAGFFSNQSNMNEPSNQSSLITHINMYGLATGYSYNMESTSITVGIIYSGGSGKAQVYEDIPTTVNVKRYTLTGVLATSYKF